MREHPNERSLVAEFPESDFAIVGVNSDKDLEIAKQAVEAHRLNWRHFWNGPDGTSGPISRGWNVTGWPTSFLIDQEGIIRKKNGAHEAKVEAIRELLDAAS